MPQYIGPICQDNAGNWEATFLPWGVRVHPIICYIKIKASGTERPRNGSRDCRGPSLQGALEDTDKAEAAEAMAPRTSDKTVPPGVRHELLFPCGFSCAPDQDDPYRQELLETLSCSFNYFSSLQPGRSKPEGNGKSETHLEQVTEPPLSTALRHPLCPRQLLR